MASNPYYTGPLSDHFDGVRFYSPGQPAPDRSLRDLWRWHRSGTRARWPKTVPVTQVKPPARAQAARLTMVGHASVLIQIAGLNLLTDPVWSERASPLSFAGPRRVSAPGIAFNDLPEIDAVLLSHNHYDHLDLATLKRLHRRDAPRMVMPLGTDATVRKAVPDARIEIGDWHDQIVLSLDVRLSLTRANHWSSRGLRDRRMALWCGYWIDAPQAQIWFAGDTGYGDGAIFHDLRARHGSPDIALIPIGAYEPRWFMAAQHVAPEDSVQIFHDIGARQALGIHWGTFQLTDEARDAPKELLAELLARDRIASERFAAFGPGDVHQAASITAQP
ncbi:membrane protein [Thioclava dalianensis]|uniref:Membrane protein n=1 Tax=Thioclava dalianensis TaxID=1185766 RepID=A0A074U9L6_9RHOB|nr:MBL fold metallo-hydrolase [Thioclava dalianensis]KEP71372.1 membrane protein [Thioclava dalianensis]SFM78531.1 L-ascorbate metabolism protein UlaG, beta-lactamase superfamily [Thioclava dalianensis]